MTRSTGYARISITMPQEVLEAADRMAATLSRSRSWLLAEAVRRLADTEGHPLAAPATPGVGTGLRPNQGEQLLAFSRYEEYLAWDRRSSLLTPAEHLPMSGSTTDLAGVCGLLNREGARYVVAGARTLQRRGSGRATGGIVLLIEPTVPNAGLVLEVLHRSGLALAREWLADAVASRAATVFVGSPRVDILTTAGGVGYAEAAAAARTVEIDGVAILMAALDHLIA